MPAIFLGGMPTCTCISIFRGSLGMFLSFILFYVLYIEILKIWICLEFLSAVLSAIVPVRRSLGENGLTKAEAIAKSD